MSGGDFNFLNDDARDLLANRPRFKEGYRDLLGYLHDLLVPFATSPEHGRFTEQFAREALQELLPLFPGSHQIGIAARSNYSTAVTLRNRCQLKKAGPQFMAYQKALDAFLGDLLTEYGNIRNIGSPRPMAPA